jgi:hypothetical protein
MIHVRNAVALICELPGMVKAEPTVALTFVNAARWTAALFIAWNWYRYQSARRTNEHIGLDGIDVPQVICPVDAALGCLKSLPSTILLDGAASILDGNGALSDDVVNIPGVVMPRTRGLADRRLECPGCQRGRAAPQSNVVARAHPKFEWHSSIDNSDYQEADTDD